MNNNTKLFGVLVAALLAFGTVGSAQNGFNTFVELGDWEYDIGDANVGTYCTLGAGGDCGLFTTGDDFTEGDLYLMDVAEMSDEVEEGALRLVNDNGFEVGTIVQDGDADEGADVVVDADANLTYVAVAGSSAELQAAELAAFFVGNITRGTVGEDDYSFADGERIDDDHDLDGATHTAPTWPILFADLDAKGDYDADEPLFADVDGTGTITVGDLILSGEDFLTLVELDGSYLANPDLINLNDTTGQELKLAILDELEDYVNNSYRGEDILLVTTSTDATDVPRVGEDSYVLTGARQGEHIDDDHAFHEKEYADINTSVTTDPPVGETLDEVVICALVGDADDDAVTIEAEIFIHFDDAECHGNDAEAGDASVTGNDVLTDDRDGELAAFAVTDDFAQSLWNVLDLDDDGEIDDGEPLVFDADQSGTLTTLDLVISEDGAFLAGPGYGHMAPDVDALVINDDGADNTPGTIEFCTYHEEQEDENGDDVWVPLAIHLRSNFSRMDESPCDEEDVFMGDFVLAGSSNVGEFLTEDQADVYEGEYATEDDADQSDYDLYFDDLFPSGFGPEDVIFLVPIGEPSLDTEAFYLGGGPVSESDDYFETDVEDLELFDAADPFVLIEGDNRGGLTENDWFYLTFDGAIDEETLILYKTGVSVGGSDDDEPPVEEPPVDEPPADEGDDDMEGPGDDDDGGESQKQPGFEVLALVAALGAALVLVRRRN